MAIEDSGYAVPDFDVVFDRRSSDSLKWNSYEADILPMWVADMDFPAPEPVVRALLERIGHPVFGYGIRPNELAEAIAERMLALYGWNVSADAVTFFPGVVPGFNVAVRALAKTGERLLIQTPVYPPILKAARNAGLVSAVNRLFQSQGGRWEIDFEDFEALAAGEVCAFLFCSPHNPVGRVFREDELAQLAEICLRNGIPIVSDEIHCDLVYAGHPHRPIASLSPEIASRTITLMAPSKTFNIAGLECAFAVIPDPNLRKSFRAARADRVPGISLLAAAAALAAYREGGPWLRALLHYLQANRDFLVDFIRSRVPVVQMSVPEGTYLAWLDCREAGLSGKPGRFFRKQGRVALSEGADFGPSGEGFVRLNFGCPRSLLEDGLHRLAAALASMAP